MQCFKKTKPMFADTFIYIEYTIKELSPVLCKYTSMSFNYMKYTRFRIGQTVAFLKYFP